MLEFVQAHTVLFAKEHVLYIDKIKKDRLWEEIGRRVGRSGQDVKCWFQSQRNASSLETRQSQAQAGTSR